MLCTGVVLSIVAAATCGCSLLSVVDLGQVGCLELYGLLGVYNRARVAYVVSRLQEGAYTPCMVCMLVWLVVCLALVMQLGRYPGHSQARMPAPGGSSSDPRREQIVWA